MIPDRLKVTTAQTGLSLWRYIGAELQHSLAFPPPIQIALKRQIVPRREAAIGPETSAKHVPIVAARLIGQIRQVRLIEILVIESIIGGCPTAFS